MAPNLYLGQQFQKPTSDIAEYEYGKQQGFKGSLMDWQQQQKAQADADAARKAAEAKAKAKKGWSIFVKRNSEPTDEEKKNAEAEAKKAEDAKKTAEERWNDHEADGGDYRAHPNHF